MTNQLPNSGSSPLDEARKLLTQTVMGWGLPGAFSLLTIHFARQKDWKPALLCLAIAAILALFLRFWSRINPRLDNLFEWFIATVEGTFIGDRFKKRYYEDIIHSYKAFRTQGLRDRSTFALSLEKLFIPLRITPKERGKQLSIIPQSATANRQTRSSIQKGQYIWDLIAAYQQHPEIRRVVILGPPGSGKTTLLEHVALTYAQHKHLTHNSQAPRLIPILLYLREHWEEIATGDSVDLGSLLQRCEQYQKLNPPPNWFTHKLQQEKCLVMLDGLDEVPEEQDRLMISRWVDQQIRNYPKACFIITSRPLGYESAPLQQEVSLYQVLNFTLDEASQFIQNWYHQDEIMRHLGKDSPGIQLTASKQAQDLIKRIHNKPELVSMALNPLLMTMILHVHCYRGALPGRRVELYQEIFDVLLGRRQEAKNITIRGELTAEQKKQVLQNLALSMMLKNQSSIKIAKAESVIQNRLSEISDESSPGNFLDSVKDSGLLIEVEKGVIQFAHKSFQEYLAAVEIRSMNQEDILLNHIVDSWWHETIRLYAAQRDASNIIDKALSYQGSQHFVYALSLAYDCLEEKLSIKAATKERLERTLKESLEVEDPEIFQLTAKVKLFRRLKGLLRLDENVDIDQGLITCAEYQLFIDESKTKDECRQPLHWERNRFPKGQANLPVSGISVEDAKAFCDWLTQFADNADDLSLSKPLSQEGTLQLRTYHLPSQQYAVKYPLALEEVAGHGYWCTADNPRTAKKHRTLFLNEEDILLRQRVIQPILDTTKERLESLKSNISEWLSSENILHIMAMDVSLALEGFEFSNQPTLLAECISSARRLVRHYPRLYKQIMNSEAICQGLAANQLLDIESNIRSSGEFFDRSINFENRKRVILLIQERLEDILKFWLSLETIYRKIAQDKKVQADAKITKETCNTQIDKCNQESQKIVELYIFFLGLEAKFNQVIPPWESIRIMCLREKISP